VGLFQLLHELEGVFMKKSHALVLGVVVLLFLWRWNRVDTTTWSDVAAMEHIYLNFGGGYNRHGHISGRYDGYVAVESQSSTMGWCVPNFQWSKLLVQGFGTEGYCGNWCVCSKVPGRFELADNTVERIHSEDCVEHIPAAALPGLLVEFHRVLKPFGRVRLSMPDYNNPKDRHFMPKPGQPDPRNTLHVTATTYSSMRSLVARSPFANSSHFVHYWDDSTPNHTPVWVQNALNLSLGYVKRAVNVDRRNTPESPLEVTSLIVDLIKGTPAVPDGHASMRPRKVLQHMKRTSN